MASRYPLFVKRDLDGFFGLAIDNLVQMLLIVSLCQAFCGMTGADEAIIYRNMLPGVAVSLLIGNLFYAMQAHWVARREGRSDVTALPYGINTPSLLVYVFFVMMPAYNRTHSAAFAWQMGLVACLGSGLIEFVGAFVAERVRRNTPRAALLSTLAGIAITFISMTFALQIWQRPLVAMVPMAVVLLVYFARARFPLGLPGGLVALALGTALAWLLPQIGVATDVPMDAEAVRQAWQRRGHYMPQWAWPAIWSLLKEDPQEVLAMLSVVIPMGLFNVIGSLQNIESAEAGGDVFATGPSLAVNGIGTIAAACFGSCFPTTIYIGHPGWKSLGARAGYSTLNGLFMTAICLTGTVSLISKAIPLEAGIPIVLWIGVVITAQAFQTSPIRHAPAAAIGLFPAIAAWGATIVAGAFTEANRNPADYSLRLAAAAPSSVVAAKTSSGATGSEGQGTDPFAAPTDTREPSMSSLPTGSRPATRLTTGPIDSPAPGQSWTSAPSPSVQPSRPTGPPRLMAATMQDLLESKHPLLGRESNVNGFLIHGLNILERGYIFTCMIIAAVSAFLIDRRFLHAAAWSAGAAVLTSLGLMHAYQLTGNVVDYWLAGTAPAQGAYTYTAYPIAMGYLLMAGVFLLMAYLDRNWQERAANTIDDARVVAGDELASGH